MDQFVLILRQLRGSRKHPHSALPAIRGRGGTSGTSELLPRTKLDLKAHQSLPEIEGRKKEDEKYLAVAKPGLTWQRWCEQGEFHREELERTETQNTVI